MNNSFASSYWRKESDPESDPELDPLVGGTVPWGPDPHQNVTDPQHLLCERSSLRTLRTTGPPVSSCSWQSTSTSLSFPK